MALGIMDTSNKVRKWPFYKQPMVSAHEHIYIMSHQ